MRDKTHKTQALAQQNIQPLAQILDCTTLPGLKSRSQIFIPQTQKFSWENFSLRSFHSKSSQFLGELKCLRAHLHDLIPQQYFHLSSLKALK
jgi:hypothetical protein